MELWKLFFPDSKLSRTWNGVFSILPIFRKFSKLIIDKIKIQQIFFHWKKKYIYKEVHYTTNMILKMIVKNKLNQTEIIIPFYSDFRCCECFVRRSGSRLENGKYLLTRHIFVMPIRFVDLNCSLNAPLVGQKVYVANYSGITRYLVLLG